MPTPDQHLLGGSEAAAVVRTSILGIVGAEGVDEVGLWLFPYFEGATWKCIQVDDWQTGRVTVRLWGFNDPNHLRDEIVSWAWAHGRNTCAHVSLNPLPPTQDSWLDLVCHLHDTPHVVTATQEYEKCVADMVGDTHDQGFSHMLTMFWILAHRPRESSVRVPSHLTPVLLV